MTTLADHIATINANTQAWVDAEPGRCAGMITDDLNHWADVGVYTAKQFDRYMLEATYSDLYKEVNGFRPRAFSYFSDEELTALVKSLSATAEDMYNSAVEWEKHYAILDAEEARMASLTESEPLPYEEYDV